MWCSKGSTQLFQAEKETHVTVNISYFSPAALVCDCNTLTWQHMAEAEACPGEVFIMNPCNGAFEEN